MTSIRNKYLAAARGLILDVGWRRATLTEVARRSGVSRMTIYRAWPDMERLLGDLLTEEWSQIAGVVVDGKDAPTTADGIADALITSLGALRSNDLIRRVLDLDPELLLPYLLQRRGRAQETSIHLLANRISAGQRAGEVRDGDPVVMARAIMLMLHGHALSSSTMVDDLATLDQLDDVLRHALAAGLRP
ncbi:TetR/AcrR family transcriptional regulator [Nocardioides limicola]|uniref:TetR/AcrR family transcriptional regulator n=1 Tax=Nocardioides limicola TaxID=2803368 RepID=UPI00193B9B47|nr:TetR/AcrR family transcriptional regulator [Nocardioides sp. DJM-14]